MNNLDIILQEFEQLKGQFVITMNDTVERLIAIGDDTEDYYYITYDGRKFTWHSCIMGLIPLKGYIRQEDYDRLVQLAGFNHYDQANEDSWLEEWTNHKGSWSVGHTLLSEVCWRLT